MNFENCIIVMTTNAGSGNGSSVSGFTETASRLKEEKTERALAEFLRPEFINRVDEIITFNNLSKADFENIACIMMEQLKSVLVKKGITLKYSSAVLKHIAENAFSEKYGARNMRRFIERNIEDPVASKIIAAQGEKIQLIRLEVDKDAIQISCE